MRPGGRAVVVSVALLAAVLLAPASAFAHAALLRTQPSASGTVNGSPARVALTYSEAVEPRFAIVSVTDAGGHNVATATPKRSPANPDMLVVPVRHLDRGWYLVYWRVISADGHPVRGAFTFAVGPNEGPAPQFVIPSLHETATSPGLLVSRWVVFLSMMCAVGLIAMRLFVARPLLRRVRDASLHGVDVAIGVTLAVAIVSVLVYAEVATAQFALRSVIDVGAVVPLMGASAFGRGFLRLDIVLVLLAAATALALWLDDPRRALRSVAAVLAICGVVCATLAALVVPGLAGHAAQYSPRGVSLLLDAAHLLAGSLWIGGLVGITIIAATGGQRRVAGLVVVVPRFSRVALASVTLLIASGTVASFIRLPTLDSLWSTGYGQALLVKIGVLIAAMGLASVNLLRTTPRLEASQRRPSLGAPAATLLRRLVAGEIALVTVAIFVAAVLSSLAPPPKALASESKALAKVGPGPVTRVVQQGRYKLAVRIAPNRAAVPNGFAVDITKDGKPVRGADVIAKFTMLDMEMGQQAYHLDQQGAGHYARRSVPALVMVGHWGLSFDVTPLNAPRFNVLIVDKAEG